MRTVFAAVVLSAALFAADAGKPGAHVSSIPVTDLNGRATSVATAGKVTAVVFISAQCPVSGAYNERMEDIYKDYRDRIQFVFINSNATEPDDMVAKHAKEHGFSFQVWRDPNNVAADMFNAQVTPEVFIIGKDSVILYHGRIDDAQNVARVTVKNMRQALDEVLAGKAVTTPEAKAFGCTIKRGKKTV